MKGLIIPILLIVAIYFGIAAVNLHDFYVNIRNITVRILRGVACAIYSRLIKDNKKD